ncbi:alkaline phosphatase [Herbiconiux daphne]|uniref:Alkaline phosphatase n=1 Tax=Herbiconiux daphne TaxID=2970914 RepID=A0ABT2GWD2_9MICO|nr:alkaline phosphatase [Herbiconiux daphne]MCS5732278.1 alkaline phosphatase [Herbiconiux daphne]
MAFNAHTSGGRRRSLIIASAALLAAASISLPAAAFADTGDDLSVNGGATRNSTDNDTKAQALRDSIVDGPAKNVILLIGDGMGDSEITIARDYAYGAAGSLPGIDALPLTGQYTTYSLFKDGDIKGKPDYVPDSAATGSAWATGTKTYDNAISVDINGAPQNTLIEIAKANGLKTGNVSTAEIQDATPAVQIAHVDARSCYGPDSATCGDDALVNGGLGSISEQLLDTRADVTLGGGSASFEQTAKAGQWNGETLFAQAEDRGYQLADDAASLAAVTKADQTEPLLGLFTPGNFPTRYAPTPATVGGADAAPVTCQPNPERLDTGLSLESLTDKAIGLLNTGDDDKGFFLQVEGASIDKQDHAANACGQIGETLDLDEAVRAALDFAEADGNTLVIVTADHAHSSQIVDSTPPTSLSAALTTVDGTTLKVSYGTAALGGSQQHTGTQLRIAAYGPGAAQVVGLTDQSDNFFTMANALELNRDTASLSSGAKATLSATTVEPGAELDLAASGFNGDRQLGSEVGSTDLGSQDVIDGTAGYTFTAPTEPGSYSLTLTGRQSGKVVTVAFAVAAADPSSPAPTTTAPAAIVGSGSGSGGSGASALGSTGAVVAPIAVLGGLLLAAGAVLVLQRRRRHHAA